MTLEKQIQDVITKQIEEGVIEKVVSEKFHKAIEYAVDDAFRSYGDIGSLIKDKVKEALVPLIEKYDFTEFVPKIDHVLRGIYTEYTHDYANIVKNFADLAEPVVEKQITITELFNKYLKFVAEDVETDGLEVEYHDEPTYETVSCTFEVFYDEKPSWSSFQYASVVFECEHDESLNRIVRISKWEEKTEWNLEYNTSHDLASLRNLDPFIIYLMRAQQFGVKLTIDVDHDEEEVTPEAQPEADFG